MKWDVLSAEDLRLAEKYGHPAKFGECGGSSSVDVFIQLYDGWDGYCRLVGLC